MWCVYIFVNNANTVNNVSNAYYTILILYYTVIWEYGNMAYIYYIVSIFPLRRCVVYKYHLPGSAYVGVNMDMDVDMRVGVAAWQEDIPLIVQVLLCLHPVNITRSIIQQYSARPPSLLIRVHRTLTASS